MDHKWSSQNILPTWAQSSALCTVDSYRLWFSGRQISALRRAVQQVWRISSRSSIRRRLMVSLGKRSKKRAKRKRKIFFRHSIGQSFVLLFLHQTVSLSTIRTEKQQPLKELKKIVLTDKTSTWRMTKWSVKDKAIEPTSHIFDHGGIAMRDWFSDKLGGEMEL